MKAKINCTGNSTSARRYKSPRKSRDPRCMDPLYDITYFETGKKKKCYACPDLIFISDVDYLFHLEESHEGQRMHCCICSECGKTFGSASELQQHSLSKCGTQARFSCTVCGKKLMSAGSLYTHTLLHGDSNYTCNFCGKQFHNVHHLKAHERTHTKAALYTCEVCGKGFCHRQSIITHSSLHTGIKPYSCEYCGKGFSCISNLLKHRKTHATTCGALPLTSHRVKNAETKMRIRMNTPATTKQKNYSQFKLKELDEKRTINAVRLLSKNKDMLLDVYDNDREIVDNFEVKNIKCQKKRKAKIKNKGMKKKLTAKCQDQILPIDIDIIKHYVDIKHDVDIKPDENILQDIEKSLMEIRCNDILKNEESDDSMPLSTYITPCKNSALYNHDDFKVKNFSNSENKTNTGNIYTSSYQTGDDIDVHMKSHSVDKLDIEYVAGFEEYKVTGRNADTDDYVCKNIPEDAQECDTNESSERKFSLSSPESGDLLIEVKRPKRSRKSKKKIVHRGNLTNSNLVDSKIISKSKGNSKCKSKKDVNQLVLQEEQNLNLQIKDEIVSDLDDTIRKHNVEIVNQAIPNEIVDEDKTTIKKMYQKRKKYVCKICGLIFKGRTWLQRHQLGKGFKDSDGKECAGRKKVQERDKFIIIPKELKYNNVYDSASDDNIPLMSRITKKERLYKGRQQFMCKICGTILKYKKWMSKHLLGKGFKNEAGDECAGPSLGRPQVTDTYKEDDEKPNYLGYKDFVETRKESRKLQCEVCKKIFSGMYWLKKHQKNKFNKDHSGLSCATVGLEKVRKCDYCPLYLEKGAQIREHKRSVHADILTCDLCHKIFSRPDILGYHRLAKHKLVPRHELPKRDYIYVCDKCGAQYKHKSSLQEHEKTGCSSGPLFKCDRCDARLHNIYTLKTHMAKHVNEKRHLCTFCGMKFMMKVQLKNHLYRHTGEKPFKCTICPKAFAHSTSLDTHMSTHTGIKRYICLACGKRFSCYGNLDKHKASKSCKEWYNLNREQKKLRILDEKPITNTN